MDNREIRTLIENELLNYPLRDCCKIPFLSGSIRGAAELSFTLKGFSLEFRHVNEFFIIKLAKIIEELYHESLPIEKVSTKAGYMEGDFFVLYIPVFIASKLLDLCKIVISKTEILDTVPEDLFAKPCCRKAYLRGLYLACGYLKLPESIDNFSLNSTKSGYEMSFKLNSEIVKDSIKKLIKRIGRVGEKSIGLRNGSNVIYLKKSDAICTLLTAIGSSKGVLEIYNIITERKMKNDINRANNLDIANIDKKIEAGEKQLAAIKTIENNLGLDSLNDNLRALAELRIDNPDASIEELGELSVPTATKSCINHRLRKIIEIAEGIRSNK